MHVFNHSFERVHRRRLNLERTRLSLLIHVSDTKLAMSTTVCFILEAFNYQSSRDFHTVEKVTIKRISKYIMYP